MKHPEETNYAKSYLISSDVAISLKLAAEKAKDKIKSKKDNQ